MRLILLAAALWGLSAAIPASANILLVPSQYPCIQSAVCAAQPGDTIRVSPRPDGTPYQESVTITTNDIRLEGDQNPVLDGSTLGQYSPLAPSDLPYFGNDGINVNADGVTVCGFVVQNYYYYVNLPLTRLACGVFVNPTNTGDIHDNTLQHNGKGLEIDGFMNSADVQTFSVSDNAVSCSHSDGINLSAVAGNIVVDHNTVFNNGFNGIDGEIANGLKIRHNTVTGNCVLTEGAGIFLSSGGTLDGDPNAQPSIIEQNYVAANNQCTGIYLQFCSGQTVSHNTVTQNLDGIDVDSCFQDNVDHNTASSNYGSGVALFDFTTDCSVTFNNADKNVQVGIWIAELFGLDTTGNTVAHNEASGNGTDAEDDSTLSGPIANTWSKNQFGTKKPTNLPN